MHVTAEFNSGRNIVENVEMAEICLAEYEKGKTTSDVKILATELRKTAASADTDATRKKSKKRPRTSKSE